MILFILGIIDLFAAALVLLSIANIAFIPVVVLAIGIIETIKGLYSLGFSSYFAAAQDMGAGVILMLVSAGIFLPAIIPAIFGFLMLIKSLQSMIFHLIA